MYLTFDGMIATQDADCKQPRLSYKKRGKKRKESINSSTNWIETVISDETFIPQLFYLFYNQLFTDASTSSMTGVKIV